jgi:hypothetical protein
MASHAVAVTMFYGTKTTNWQSLVMSLKISLKVRKMASDFISAANSSMVEKYVTCA